MTHEIQTTIETRQYDQPMDFETLQNPWGSSPKLLENQERVGPVSENKLIRSLGEWLSIEPRSITLGANGSTEIIDLIPQLFIPTGSSCIVITPTYFGLCESLKKAGDLITQVRTRPEVGFIFDTKVIEDLSTLSERVHPSLIWLCSPNNPTGVVIDPDVIDGIAKKNPDTLIVVDEAYQEIVDPDNVYSMVRRIYKRKNILVTKTFSKTWGLPDIKIGIAIGDVSMIEKIKLNNTKPSINQKSLILAEAALSDTDHLKISCIRMQDELTYMKTHVSAMSHLAFGSQSETGVCIVRHDTINLGDALAKRNIRTLDCDLVWGLEGLGFVHIGLQTHEKNKHLISHLWQLDS